MKKTLVTVSLLTLAFLTGCGQNTVKTSSYQDAFIVIDGVTYEPKQN